MAWVKRIPWWAWLIVALFVLWLLVQIASQGLHGTAS